MRNRWLNLLVAVAVSLPLLWCFGTSLAGGRVFAYRDVAHFYYPLEAWISDRWSHGDVPLWNRQDGNGMPVVAETTSAVFYPGKLVFALPLTFNTRFVLYVVLHVALAAWGAYRLTRCVIREAGIKAESQAQVGPVAVEHAAPEPLSVPAAGLAAVAYACGGTVLFQYANVVFLVGAAWLPWTLLAMHHLLHERRRLPWVLAVGVCLALAVLGGDPQTAYHAGLLGILYAILDRRTVADRGNGDEVRSAKRISTVGAIGWLATSAVVAGLLAAVQIVPAWSWVGNSDRGVFTYPRSLYDLPAYFQRSPALDATAPVGDSATCSGSWAGAARGIFGKPAAREHHGQVYSFSVAPWRLVEMLWPNCAGRTFPQNHRWLSAARAEDRIWSPSLYLGILPALLAIGTWRLRNAAPLVKWFSWILILAVVASFGSYGLGLFTHFVEQLFTGEPSTSTVGEPVGGLYWFMVVALPGYAQFRYPAKWMVVATLAAAVLAGSRLDQVLAGTRERFASRLRIVGTISLLAAVGVGLTQPWWGTWFDAADPDELFGPFSARGAWFDTWTACAHTALVCGIAWICVNRQRSDQRGLATWLLLLTACDIAWANGWLILTAPASSSTVATVVDGARARPSGSTFYRWPSRTWVPDQWRTTSSPSRAAENLRWDVATLYAKLHLLGTHRSLAPQSTVGSYDFRTFLGAGSGGIPHPAILAALGAEYVILPDTYSPAAPWRLDNDVVTAAPGVAVWKNPWAFPAAWIVHDVQAWPPFASTDPQAISRHIEELLFPRGGPRDLRHTAVIECAPRIVAPATTEDVGQTARESVYVTAARGRRVELDVALSAPGLVVLNQLYDPRWTVAIQSDTDDPRTALVVRTNRIMQGVFLPAGRHHLVFCYVPRDLYAAGAVSLASWLALAAGLGWFRCTRRQHTRFRRS